jgi:predicted component of type VI protein secretion system
LAPKEKYLDLDKMELESRKLFSCFDSMIAKKTAVLEYILLVYNSVFPQESFARSFIGAFGLPEEGWNSEELLFWMLSLPGFHQWAGTKRGTERILSKYLGMHVRIKEHQRGENGLPQEIQSFLGRRYSRLGRDWSLGDRFSECESSFRLVIGPISARQVRDFRPWGTMRKKLDRVLKHCVPGQLRWSVALKLKRKERNFSLGERTANCVLGYSTYPQTVKERHSGEPI